MTDDGITGTFQTYRDEDGQWRWRLVAGNNRVVARCERSFTEKRSARRACLDILSDIRGDRIGIEDVPAERGL